MSQLLFRPLAWLLVAILILPGLISPIAQLPDSSPPPASEANAETPLWNVWGADQYALADDGASIWIGAVGGVVQWDKQTGTYRRYTRLDGLPHTQVLAIAVDASGNRWFGGDGGLSRLDAAGNWTHFQSTNSGLHSNDVDGIAVVGGDTVYVSHGLPGGSVDRRDSDGSWRWYPNRETAIQADYATIVQTRGSNTLWTAAGSEVWAGTSVFNGERWLKRELPFTWVEVLSLAVDSRDRVWALSSGYSVFEWDGVAWSEYPVPISFTGKVTALAVDQADNVWVGLQERGENPYTNEHAAVRNLTGSESYHFILPGPVASLVATPAGLWGVGPGWVMRPDFETTVLTDGPRFEGVSDAMAASGGQLWIYSGIRAPYSLGLVQTLDDKGTADLSDDDWQTRPPESFPYADRCEVVTAFEHWGNDAWYSSYCHSRGPMNQKAVRYRNEERIEYGPPFSSYAEVNDIFAQDARHTWFVTSRYESTGMSGAALGLDDGGTPAELADDTWVTIPIASVSGKLSVALDGKGRLWHGQASGLYRYDGSAWQLAYGDRAVCDLVPASDGTLFAQVESESGGGCEKHPDRVVAAHPDGSVDAYPTSVWNVVSQQTARVQTASRRNDLWTVAGDGAIWFVDVSSDLLFWHRAASAVEGYRMPIAPESVERLEVDRRGHVWIVSGGKLWRMEGPRPDFVNVFLPLITR